VVGSIELIAEKKTIDQVLDTLEAKTPRSDRYWSNRVMVPLGKVKMDNIHREVKFGLPQLPVGLEKNAHSTRDSMCIVGVLVCRDES